MYKIETGRYVKSHISIVIGGEIGLRPLLADRFRHVELDVFAVVGLLLQLDFAHLQLQLVLLDLDRLRANFLRLFRALDFGPPNNG